MKQLLCLAVMALLLLSCEIKIEIPNRQAGVVITNEGEVKDEVLRPGKQIVRTDSRVILYEVGYEQLENDFDFLFKDASRGDVKLTIEFIPVVDSLPGFYRKFESIYVSPVVDVKSRSIIRDLLMNYNPTELNDDELSAKIVEALTNNRELTNYVNLRKVDVMELRR